MAKRIDWKLIFLLALIGPLMGLRGVFNIIPGSEPFFWIGFGIISAIIIGRKAPGRFYVHGFFTGLLWGLLAVIVEVLFFTTYLANNPQYAAEFEAVKGVSPEVYMLLFGAAVGIVTGLVLGAMSWIFRRRAGSA